MIGEAPRENIKDIIKREYLNCATDLIYFLRKYCYIQHPVRGRILFGLYPFQEELLYGFRQNRFVVVNKSRQLGISTLVAGYSLWLILFHTDKNVLCIATKQDTAKNLVTKVTFMYENLPSWLKGTKKPLENNKLSLKLNNGSQIKALTAAKDTGRSEAVSLLILDEAAFIEDIDKIYTSIKPTITTGGGCIALSSPNGIGNWFHKIYTGAELKENDFLSVELPWQIHPERDQKWFDEETRNMSPKEIAQEYCCDFLSSGTTVVDPEIIKFIENESGWIVDPIEKRGIGNPYWLWQYPDVNRKYIIPVDVARGDGSDFSTFHVIDIEANEQVAEFKAQIGTKEFAHLLQVVGFEWSTALLIIENNGLGWDVVSSLAQFNYPNLYYSPRGQSDLDISSYIDKLNNDQTVPGFTNSLKTRPLIVSKLEAYLRDRSLIIHSVRTLEEAKVFIWKNGRGQATDGYNDDLMIPLGIGMYVRDTSWQYLKYGTEMNRSMLNGFQRTQSSPIILPKHSPNNPFKINLGNKGNEDISWVLR